MMQHWAIFIKNNSNKNDFVRGWLKGELPKGLEGFKNKKGVLLSKLTVEHLMDEEDRHDTKIVTKNTEQSLRSMSSGEQKKAVLAHLLNGSSDFIILDNPLDNLDTASQAALVSTLTERSVQTVFIQIISRKKDLLPFISKYAFLDGSQLVFHNTLDFLSDVSQLDVFKGNIPRPLQTILYSKNVLIALKDVTIRFGEKTVLKSINWTIEKNEFWQLVGKNGSGKTTLLSMITGENPKGYGQNLFLFGHQKGSGESIWDIKKNIGYFTPAMTDKFTGHHTIENMLISGLNDSIGLYVKPTETQQRLAKEWLLLIDMWALKERQFCELSMGQQRLIMTVRAMLKHPLLLILDEPTAGLDDASAALLVALVNKISRESETTTIFVSHREEPGLEPDFVYELRMTEEGSVGIIN